MPPRPELVATLVTAFETPTLVGAFAGVVAGIAASAIIAFGGAISWWRGRRAPRQVDTPARRDELTGLATRSSLIADFVEDGADKGNVTLHLFDLVGFKKYNDAFGFAAGDALLRHLARRIAAAIGHDATIYRLRGAQFALVSSTPIGERHLARTQISGQLRESGEGFLVECASGTVVIPHQARDIFEALKLADQELQAERSALRRRGLDEGLITPSASTGLPSSPHEVSELAVSVGHLLGLDFDELQAVRSSTRWRDVGMMAIPNSILHSSERLSDDEWRFVKLHTLVSERLLRSNFGLHRVAEMVRSSHERWDGNGYPDGLAGHDIPIGARIVFVCSAFQDMTSPRAHRPALAAARALDELRRNAGGQFDPQVVAAFIDAFAESSASTAPQFTT